ncbi:MAG: hypothetical protein H8E71_06925 [Candidatus Marinimicrobia bacterium]|nr:hypothetical protein [Candidatus Neomarinimicrobiota bacterium]MBL7109688.1 hypothetical protein [Candidatus Neomarinimicrobiota bacterium]
MLSFSYNREIKRKLFHLSSSVIGISLLLVGKSIVLPITILLTFIVLFFDIIRNRNTIIKDLYNKLFQIMTRPQESNNLTGASWLLFGASITMLLFDELPSATGLLFLSIGDSVAALFGRKYGKTKIGHKSLEGSIAFFISCVIISLFIPGLNIWVGVISASVATVVELVGIFKLNDNFTIPIVTALFVQIFGGLF